MQENWRPSSKPKKSKQNEENKRINRDKYPENGSNMKRGVTKKGKRGQAYLQTLSKATQPAGVPLERQQHKPNSQQEIFMSSKVMMRKESLPFQELLSGWK